MSHLQEETVTDREYAPLTTPWAAMNIIAVSAELKITFWPELRNASEVAILMLLFSYDASALSYCATSKRSLLKFWDMREGTVKIRIV
jgi:hypothetical protein